MCECAILIPHKLRLCVCHRCYCILIYYNTVISLCFILNWQLLSWLVLFGASMTSSWTPLSQVSASYWYYENYDFKVCVILFSFYSIQLLSWLLLFGASNTSSQLSLSRVSALYWYYKNYGCVYVNSAIVYWSTKILVSRYVLFWPKKWCNCEMVDCSML